MVINDNYKLAPWADYLYACDLKWWDWHKGTDFQGEKWTQDQEAADKYGLNYIESKREEGLSTDPKAIHQGSNSGYQAINLAYHLGADRIILIGYDMQKTDGKAHWFGDHPDKIESHYSGWTRFYKTLADDAQNVGLEIINCTHQTALDCFPRMRLELALS